MASYDIIIVGGGIVGLTAALMLSQKTNLHIAVVDAKPLVPSWQSGDYEPRVSAISLASQRLFENLQVFPRIKQKRFSVYEKMHVWDANSSGILDFDSGLLHKQALGFIIEDQVIRAALLEQLQQEAKVALLTQALTTLHEFPHEMILQTAEGESLTAKLIIAADGGNSWVREQVAFTVKQRDYQHTAIVATVKTSLPHQKTAWQRFLPTGPLAFLPLDDGFHSSIVWSVMPEKAQDLLALHDADFSKALTEAFAGKLGDVIAVSQRRSFPLQMRHARQYVKQGLALVGDAAHTIHPLAGQGVNLGILDAVSLCQVVISAWHKQRDFASLATLRAYERERKAGNATMLNFVDLIKRLFASDSATVQALRSQGLNVVNQMPLLKQFFANYAAGKGEISCAS